ncbi:MAG: tetratricopeptide repeat protein [Deltaproteobacteria bacterium]|nr:tetratricopeptide repeat protein [Deltaproteobacteria bacterium]
MGDLLFFSVGPRRGMRRAVGASAWYERGCALEAGSPTEAMGAYRRAIAGQPDLADAQNNLGRLHHDQGALAAAESCYRLAVCGNPMVALYWFNLGVVVEDLGRAAEAIEAYECALGLDQTFADAHYNLARILEVVGRRANDDLAIRRAIRHLSQYKSLVRTSATRRR